MFYTAVLHDLRPTDNHKLDWYLTGIICSERTSRLAPMAFFIARPDWSIPVILVTRTLALWGFNKPLTVFVVLAALELTVSIITH